MKTIQALKQRIPHLAQWRRHLAIFASLLSTTLLSGCAIDRLLNSEPLEGSVVDPSIVQSRDGAIRSHRSALKALTKAAGEVFYTVALFTDELTAENSVANANNRLDARITSIPGFPGVLNNSAYDNLHVARIRSSQSSALLKAFGSSNDSALIGEAYAIQGQAIVHLAELFCSGIPLTRVPIEGGLEYMRGMSTQEILEIAVALFDTAIGYAGDSVRVSEFARIGKGRALVNLGLYNEAQDAVKDVATSYKYILQFVSDPARVAGVTFWPAGERPQNQSNVAVVSSVGGVGMDWLATDLSMQDPRVPVTATSPYRQQKIVGASVSIALAKGIEARMIEAEALLQPATSPSGDWLAPLNIARASIGLSALTDPGTATSRIDLLFRERAFWFYYEGHRLADYRRLVRQYNRVVATVYPHGAHGLHWTTPAYEPNYVFVPSHSEEELNPLYSGCIHFEP